MPSLREVSNLPIMKVFTVISCPNLETVSGVNSLQHIHMEDEQLPKWLGQHFSRIETLDILGKKQLLVRCERSKEDWYIVREIPRVYAYLPKRLPYFSYARGNDFFCKYKTQRTGSTVSSSSTGNDDSPLGPAAPLMRPTRNSCHWDQLQLMRPTRKSFTWCFRLLFHCFRWISFSLIAIHQKNYLCFFCTLCL